MHVLKFHKLVIDAEQLVYMAASSGMGVYTFCYSFNMQAVPASEAVHSKVPPDKKGVQCTA